MEKEENKVTEVSKETKVKKDDKLFKKPEGKAMYQKQREEADDAETEAPFKRTLKHLKKLQAPMTKLLLQLNALKMQKTESLKNVMTI
jgi:hypothetical protein